MAKVVTIPEKLDVLPYEILTWERFQTFCTDLLYKCLNSIESREYLQKGSDQHGIDIYVVTREIKLSVAQCKLRKKLAPKDIANVINDFLEGELVEDVREFLLCTNIDLSKKGHEKALTRARSRLRARNIEFKIWDGSGISKEIRTNPTAEVLEIVYHYFDEHVCKSFFGPKWESHLERYAFVERLFYEKPNDYISRNIVSYDDRISSNRKSSWQFPEETIGKNTLFNIISQNDTHSRIVLLSSAGFGKSQELENIAGEFSLQASKFYPFKYSLVNYDGNSIEEILLTWSKNWHNVRNLGLILLFDGLDEIELALVQIFYKKLNAFLEINPTVNVVISSRYNFYEIINQPLKGFTPYFLNPLNKNDINEYIDLQLGHSKEVFLNQIEQNKFSEYLINPYYLTRLVRFYNDPHLQFPSNRIDLFERILFDQMGKDETIYSIPELRSKMLPFALKIAFCMTMSGKSSLSNQELATIIPDEQNRKLLRHLCILNKNPAANGLWTFEHKNLQEYLCATALLDRTFEEIKALVAYRFDKEKILPQLHNTIAFLFELVNKDNRLFHELFTWIRSIEPELIVQFEKEQLSLSTRHEIFHKIFEFYEQKSLSLRHSSNFSIRELSAFIDLDDSIIDYLKGKIFPGQEQTLLFDVIYLLAHAPRPFVTRNKIIAVLDTILKTEGYSDGLKATVVRTFYYLNFTDHFCSNLIFDSQLNLFDIEIRKACIYFLEYSDSPDDYAEFILESIKIFTQSGCFDFEAIKRLIFRFRKDSNFTNLFQYCIINENAVSVHHGYRAFHFTLEEFRELITIAIDFWKRDKSILRVIYRLFCSAQYVSLEADWFKVFHDFFVSTSGTRIIFEKFYKYDKRDRDLLAFADEYCCDFLIEEYKKGFLSDQEMIVFRNVLSHINRPLFQYFYDQIMLVSASSKFLIDEFEIDYKRIGEEQKLKNQKMLLDKSLFLEEARIIFNIINKEIVTTTDFWISSNIKLSQYQDSIVFSIIRRKCYDDDDKLLSEGEFYTMFEDENDWQGFVIDSIKEFLERKNEKSSLDPKLLKIFSDWLIEQVSKIDFEKHGIIDNPDGSYTYFPHTEFVKQSILLLNISFSDEQLLKLLLSDHSSFYRTDNKEKSVMSIVLEQFRDKVALKSAVLRNLRNQNLSFRVQLTHFRICQVLNYRECLGLLYLFIKDNELLGGYERIKLADIYIDLGGKWVDFNQLLRSPTNTSYESSYTDWNWFLLEKLLTFEPEKTASILLSVLKENDLISNNAKASELLIRLSRIEGLEFWLESLKNSKRFLEELKWSSLSDFVKKMPFEPTVKIFIEALEFYIEEELDKNEKNARLMVESVFESLVGLAQQDHPKYTHIKETMTFHLQKFTGTEKVRLTNYYLERLTQRYFESVSEITNIKEASLLYDKLISEEIS